MRALRAPMSARIRRYVHSCVRAVRAHPSVCVCVRAPGSMREDPSRSLWGVSPPGPTLLAIACCVACLLLCMRVCISACMRAVGRACLHARGRVSERVRAFVCTRPCGAHSTCLRACCVAFVRARTRLGARCIKRIIHHSQEATTSGVDRGCIHPPSGHPLPNVK